MSSNTVVRNRLLQILLLNEIFRNVSSYLISIDVLELLACSSSSYNTLGPWITVYKLLGLTNIKDLPQGVNCQIPRSFVIHCIRNLGYNCVRCCLPLTGPQGFFACTTLCTSCSLKAFVDSGSTSYVDGSIRFYLSGEKSIITKGRAFLTPPYFISDDDKYHEKFFTEYGGDPYQLAEEIYAEKNFFKKFCANNLKILRPRDDKAGTLRKMLDHHYLYEDVIGELRIKGKREVSLFNEQECYHDFPISDQEALDSNRENSEIICSKTSKIMGNISQPEWSRNLPKSLIGIYEGLQGQSLTTQNFLSLGTFPLRELVVQMHNREGAVIKQLK